VTLNIEISPNGQTPNLYKDNLVTPFVETSPNGQTPNLYKGNLVTRFVEISPNGQTPNLYKGNVDLIVRLVLCDVLTIHYVIANGRMRGSY